MPGGARQQRLGERAPGNQPEEIGDDREEDDVGEGPLQKVGDDDRHLTAGEDEEERHSEHARHEQRKDVERQSRDHDFGGKPQQGDEETRRDRRKDSVIDDSGDERDQTGEHAELPAVAHLEELGERHRTSLAIAVDHPARERDDDHRGTFHQSPPDRGVGDVVVLLPVPDQGDHTELRHSKGDGDQIATGTAIGREKTGNARRMAARALNRKKQRCHKAKKDYPVEYRHRHATSLIGFVRITSASICSCMFR